MPELAEVEHYRRRWAQAVGSLVTGVDVHPRALVFRGCDVTRLEKLLSGARLLGSEASAKQMLFRFDHDAWLGIHLGMTGELRIEPDGYRAGRHDHLVLRQTDRTLVFSDFRMLGRIRFDVGAKAPVWWTSIAPPILSENFTVEAVCQFLKQRAKSPIKAVLLMQERFPGIGNWMADEILWRSAIHPRRPAGSLTTDETRSLWKECRWVCREALRVVSPNLADPPKSWLFPHRWAEGGICPRTKATLIRETIGGRTTCWSPARQSQALPRRGS